MTLTNIHVTKNTLKKLKQTKKNQSSVSVVSAPSPCYLQSNKRSWWTSKELLLKNRRHLSILSLSKKQNRLKEKNEISILQKIYFYTQICLTVKKLHRLVREREREEGRSVLFISCLRAQRWDLWPSFGSWCYPCHLREMLRWCLLQLLLMYRPYSLTTAWFVHQI